AGPESQMRVTGDAVEVVSIGDVRIRDGNAFLLHRCNVGERNSGGHSIESGKSGLTERIRDRTTEQIVERRSAGHDRIDRLSTEQALEADVGLRLARQQVALSARTNRRVDGAMNCEPDEIGLRQRTSGTRRGRGGGGLRLGELRRARTEYFRDVARRC